MTIRVALLSDVHADVAALEDALASAARLGCTRFVCAGDVVDYGPSPNETIALLIARDVPTVRGNHDRWAAAPSASAASSELSAASREWLGHLPTVWSDSVAGTHVVVTHARPRHDMHGVDPRAATADEVRAMLASTRADVLVVGHTHEPFELELRGWGTIVNPGALLRDPPPGTDHPPATGTFGVLELPSRTFSVHRARDGALVEVVRRVL